MKVGLIPWWAGPSSGTSTASLSLLPLSIPLLTFSGNTAVSTERSWGTQSKGSGWGEREAKEGEGTSPFSHRKGDPALILARKEADEEQARG